MTEPTEEELDALLNKIKNEYKDGWTEENWQEEMERHPFFMTKPIDENAQDLPPAIEALRQIKWEDVDSTLEKALQLKDEGNMFFKVKKYNSAVKSYNEALKLKLNDKNLISILYSNSAAANYYLGNYRSTLRDCIFARKFNAINSKALNKGAEACFQLKRYDDAIKWCDDILELNPSDEKIVELRSKSEKSKKLVERDRRKAAKQEKTQNEREQLILKLVKDKKIKVQDGDESFDLFSSACNPQQSIVTLGEDNQSLYWPCVFLYPECGQTDFIEKFHESSVFEDHLRAMFNETPSWDIEAKYKCDALRIYYENRKTGRLVSVSPKLTLLKVLQSDGYVIQLGTPSFTIMVKNSNFEKMYLKQYESVSL